MTKNGTTPEEHLDAVTVRGVRRSIKPPLHYEVEEDGGWFIAREPSFDLECSGDSREVAISELADHFRALVEGYALEEDVRLSPTARALKQRLLAILG